MTINMQTEWLDGLNRTDLNRAVQLLQQGECVAVPTETVYGLAADARNADAVRGIFTAKGRPANHPLIVHLASAAHLPEWAIHIPAEAWLLADAFWPGPLTLLLHKAPNVPIEVTGGLPSIGLRVPAHPQLLALLQQLDSGVAAPSANPYKALSPTSAAQVIAGLEGRIAAVLDGGACEFGLESTIVDLTQPERSIRILRAGPISRIAIEHVLGRPVEAPQQHNEAVPGNVQAHYQPLTSLHLYSSDELVELTHNGIDDDIGLLLWSPRLIGLLQDRHSVQTLPDNALSFAQALYQTLHAADQHGYRQLWLERPPTSEEWLAINDRLMRASCE